MRKFMDGVFVCVFVCMCVESRFLCFGTGHRSLGCHSETAADTTCERSCQTHPLKTAEPVAHGSSVHPPHKARPQASTF